MDLRVILVSSSRLLDGDAGRGDISEAAIARANVRLSDFNAVEAVVDATHRYPEMFYSKEQ